MVLVSKKGQAENVEAKVLRSFYNGGPDKRVLPGAIVTLPGTLFRELEAAGKVKRAGKGEKDEPVLPTYGKQPEAKTQKTDEAK